MQVEWIIGTKPGVRSPPRQSQPDVCVFLNIAEHAFQCLVASIVVASSELAKETGFVVGAQPVGECF